MNENNHLTLLIDFKNMTAQETYAYWLAAFRHEIKRKTMTQAALARTIKKDFPDVRGGKGRINEIYRGRGRKNPVTGKQEKPAQASADLQEAISRAFGYSHMEFLSRGRAILEGLPLDNGYQRNVVSEEIVQHEEQENVDPLITLHRAINIVAEEHERARADRNYLSMVLNKLPTPVCITNSERIVEYQNQAHIDIYGMSLIDKNICGRCGSVDTAPGKHCNDCPIALSVNKGVLETKEVIINGRCAEVIAKPVSVRNGQTKVLITVRNLEKYRAAKKESTRCVDMLKTILNSTKVFGLMFIDHKKRVREVNNRFLDLLNKKPEELSRYEQAVEMVIENTTDPSQAFQAIKRARDERKFAYTFVGKFEGVEHEMHFEPLFNNAGDFAGILTRLGPTSIMKMERKKRGEL